MAEVDAENLFKSPLYSYYQEKKIKLVDFAGWALPIQFTKISEEHHAVRKQVGLFDVSHMGEIEVRGNQAINWLNSLVTNDLTLIEDNQAQYNTMTNEAGGTLDDLLLYKFADDHFFVTPNGSNVSKIYNWMEKHLVEHITIHNRSKEYGLIALQGPKSMDVLKQLTDADLTDLRSYHFLPSETVGTISDVIVSRTGYTGEDGFELYVKWDQTESLWKSLVEAGSSHGLKECGLGARDTLRLEAGMALYGQDLSEDITPLEGGVGFAVKVNKETSFIGQEALRKQKSEGLKRISRGFELVDKGIARNGYPVLNEQGEEIGFVTSGTQSPSLEKSIGMMILDKAYAKLGEAVWIQVRKKKVKARLTKKDWLKSLSESK